MCYVHILQYDTATILGNNATQSGLHGFRVRPQRSGTVVTRHNAEFTVSTENIFGFRGRGHNEHEDKLQTRGGGPSAKINDSREDDVGCDGFPQQIQTSVMTFYSCSGFEFCVSAQKFPCVDSGDCILNPLLSLRLLQP